MPNSGNRRPDAAPHTFARASTAADSAGPNSTPPISSGTPGNSSTLFRPTSTIRNVPPAAAKSLGSTPGAADEKSLRYSAAPSNSNRTAQIVHRIRIAPLLRILALADGPQVLVRRDEQSLARGDRTGINRGSNLDLPQLLQLPARRQDGDHPVLIPHVHLPVRHQRRSPDAALGIVLPQQLAICHVEA